MSELQPQDRQFLEDAAAYLESPSFLMRLADAIGKPLALTVQGLEKLSPAIVENAVERALQSAMNVAVYTIPAASPGGGPTSGVTIEPDLGKVGSSTSFWHGLSVGVTGTAGGFFGVVGLPIELPVTTTIMFRSIASVAKEFGEDLADPAVRFQCLSVFSLGGSNQGNDELDGAYLTARGGLETIIGAAAKFVAGKSAEELGAAIQKGTAPYLVNLLAKIAARFNVAVSEKFMAQALPVAGALGGAAINVAFMDHFNRVARYHFGIRSLERKHGAEHVQGAYREAMQQVKGRRR